VLFHHASSSLLSWTLKKVAPFQGVIGLSKKAYRAIMTNFYGTVAVDGIGVTLGFLSPLLAAGIHVVSELVFILNSARLIR
jgi:P-type Cu+ transporter